MKGKKGIKNEGISWRSYLHTGLQLRIGKQMIFGVLSVYSMVLLAAGTGGSLLHRELPDGKSQQARGAGPDGPSPAGAPQQRCRQLLSPPEKCWSRRPHDRQFVVHAVYLS